MCLQNLAIEPCLKTGESIPVLTISRQVLCHVSRSISTKCEPWLDAAGRNFEASVWNKVSWTAGRSRTPNSLRMQAFCSGKVNPGEQGHYAKRSAKSAVVCLAKYNLIFMKFSLVRFLTNLCMEPRWLSELQRKTVYCECTYDVWRIVSVKLVLTFFFNACNSHIFFCSVQNCF
jgi:hypothetical protein